MIAIKCEIKYFKITFDDYFLSNNNFKIQDIEERIHDYRKREFQYLHFEI